ncbi:MAG: DUF2207 domain-containing protein [Dehalococcoidia bacterium]
MSTRLAPFPRRSRRIGGALLVALLLAGMSLALLTRAATAAGERILSYTIDATVEATGDVLFQEAIVYDFDGASRHGIYRDVITGQRFDDRYDRAYELEVLSVTSPSPGTPATFTLEDLGGTTRIKIGDPDRTVTGVHTYLVTYRLRGTLNGFPDHDELYWNIIGHDWAVPIERAAVTVRAPRAPTKVACFAGPDGSAAPCAQAAVEGDHAVFAAAGLDAYEGMTIVVALPKGAVPQPAPILRERWSAARAFAVDTPRIVLMAVVLLAVVAGVARLVWIIGRDRQWRGQPVAAIPAAANDVEDRVPLMGGAVTPTEYLPPEGMRPGLVGTVVDEVAHPLDVSATIVDLAVRGYLRIEEIEVSGWFGSTDWKLTRLKPSQGLEAYETLLMDGLFEDGDEVKFSDLRQHFATRMANVQSALYRRMVERGWYRRSPKDARALWLGLGFGALAGSIALCVATAAFTTLGIVPLPLVLGALVLLALHGRMPARTATGTATYRRVLGFRRFIVEAETNRARFAEQAGLFYEYLPYAIVFGATEQWARAFEGLALPAPDWYVSSHPFTTLALAGAMSDFSDRSVGALTSTPGGSGGSGFSGGFSGGGGGGGGGGSW